MDNLSVSQEIHSLNSFVRGSVIPGERIAFFEFRSRRGESFQSAICCLKWVTSLLIFSIKHCGRFSSSFFKNHWQLFGNSSSSWSSARAWMVLNCDPEVGSKLNYFNVTALRWSILLYKAFIKDLDLFNNHIKLLVKS